MDFLLFPSEPIKPSSTDNSRLNEQYQVFIARVVRVDNEKKIVSIFDQRNGQTYQDVSAIPANSSSPSSTDVDMPEEGSMCLAVSIDWQRGYAKYVILNYLTSDTVTGQDAVANRAIDDHASAISGWTNRTRGVYRKAYPGQHTIVKTDGYTSKTDSAWDFAAADYSRDQLDPFRRTRTTSTGRLVNRTDHSLKFEGYVNRPNADSSDITPHRLPDGSKEWILYLNPTEKDWKARYYGGAQDMLPFVERVEKVQEFGLDFPVPHEIYETDMWDTLLGVTQEFLRTDIKTKKMMEDMQYDDQSFLIEQNWDHPTVPKNLKNHPGPSRKEGKTPRRRGWIIEKSEGTLVGSNQFDKATYGKVLKPAIFPLTKEGRFGDPNSTYVPINKMTDQTEARMAASAWSLRFPYEYNTTRFDITKEGMLQFEVGSTIPKENIGWDGGTYEHPHGAGRSVEGHFVGSVKLMFGKNRDEEESLDLQTVGGAVIRLGADDASLPQDRREVKTQIRGKKDMLTDRGLQWWSAPKYGKGDPGDLANKTGFENVSLRSAMDGGLVLRVGARAAGFKRRHFINGYKDGQGKTEWTGSDRKDARTKGRPVYDGVGDGTYRFHDLSLAGQGKYGQGGKDLPPYTWSGAAIDPEEMGLSADIHLVRDLLLRIGSNKGVSAGLDLDGAIVAAVGKDQLGRSLVATFDGGIEASIGSSNPSAGGRGLKLEIDGDVDIAIKGNLHLNVTGEIITEARSRLAVVKGSDMVKAIMIQKFANAFITHEAPRIQNNEIYYVSQPDGYFKNTPKNTP